MTSNIITSKQSILLLLGCQQAHSSSRIVLNHSIEPTVEINMIPSAVCGVNCHKKCERHMPNLCGVDQKLMAETLQQLRAEKSQSITANKSGGGGVFVAAGKIRNLISCPA